MFYRAEVNEDENDIFLIPIEGVQNICFISWKENESWGDCLIRMGLVDIIDCTFHVWSKLDGSDPDSDEEDGTFFCNVYEVKCCKSNKLYYLVSYREINTFEDIRDCVCLVHNRWNIVKFFRENLLPFVGKNFFFG